MLRSVLYLNSTLSSSVTTPSPPAFVQQPSEESVLLGDTANFRCIVTGEPQPYISWMRNGRALDGEVSPYLIIPSVGTANRGFYTCQATNREGTITSEQALLRIQSKQEKIYCLYVSIVMFNFCIIFQTWLNMYQSLIVKTQLVRKDRSQRHS